MTSISSLAADESGSKNLGGGQDDADTIIERLAELRPWLRSMQVEAEKQRRVPQETIERLDGVGVYALASPPRFGGSDFSSSELFRIYEALGRGCGSTAWTLWASSGGNLWSAAFADDAVRPVYDKPWVGNRTCAVGGSTRRLAGTARQVADGWMIKGAWPFATGSVHASHAYLAVFHDEVDDSKVGMVLISKESYELRNNWDPMGLAGTGSWTIVIEEELFVPDTHFSSPQILMERLALLEREGFGLRKGGLGRSIMVGTGNAIGMAEHALELFLGGIAKKAIAYSPYNRQQDAPVTHLNVGYASMQIKAARRLAEAAIADLDRLNESGEEVSAQDIVRYHADGAYVWDSCATAIEILFKASGASGIMKSQPLQLIARNCRAGSMHAAHNIQTCMENFGRQMCGVETKVTSASVLERAP